MAGLLLSATPPEACMTTLAERGADAVTHMPRLIRVAAFDIEIKLMTAGQVQTENAFGQWRRNEQAITMSEHPGTPANAVDTLLHELNHAIWWAYGIGPKDDEERTVATFATAWTALYRDNPDLLRWIHDTLHAPKPMHPLSRDELSRLISRGPGTTLHVDED